MSATEAVWMPPHALALLTEELARLGALPNRSMKEEARFSELRSTLRSAEASRKPDDGLVEPGMRITARFSGDDAPSTFLLGMRELASLDPEVDIDVYSPTSPLGAAIIGSYVGDSITYTTASGATMSVTILEASPY